MSFQAPAPTGGDRAEVERAGLCASCRHLQVLRSKRSTFVRCGMAERDPAFARYPPLPVRLCRGHEPVDGDVGCNGEGTPGGRGGS